MKKEPISDAGYHPGVSSTCRKCGRRGRDGYCTRHRPEKRPRDDGDYRRSRNAMFATDSGRCWLCGSATLLPGERWSGDHVVPRSLGGDHALANIRRAHQACNERRGAREVTGALLADLAKRRRQDEYEVS